ncbi:hypothetical protein [Sphingobium sp. Sx8-8]|uniref:hypothetical protein n=1 Tax=Sphingobium sp. Sx8-8 TaxID=2933617 RepID=UPI001F59A56E|nr:hypothetical protein [Sphingobium sp. Sx8-8]
MMVRRRFCTSLGVLAAGSAANEQSNPSLANPVDIGSKNVPVFFIHGVPETHHLWTPLFRSDVRAYVAVRMMIVAVGGLIPLTIGRAFW